MRSTTRRSLLLVLVGLATALIASPASSLLPNPGDFNKCDDFAPNPEDPSPCCGEAATKCLDFCKSEVILPSKRSACELACIQALDDCRKGLEVVGSPVPSLWREGFFPEVYPTRKKTGDFNGDGFDDLIVFVNTTYSDERRGDVWVALSNGRDGFEAPQLWRGWLCAYGSQICEVGDFDGDGMDDVYVLTRGDGAGRGYVGIARSLGDTFVISTPYKGEYGRDWSDLEVADMNDDGRDDVVLFRKGTGAYAGDGQAVVLLSDGVDLAPQTTGGAFPGCRLTAEGCDQPLVAHPVWHDGFCYDGDKCRAGDLDGDGYADLVAFREGYGDVIYTSCGYSWGSRRYTCFDVPSPLPFPMDSLTYDLVDADGDGQEDLVGFASEGSVTFGSEFLRDTSSGSPVLELTVTEAPFTCWMPQACQLADVNGDALGDLVELTFVEGGIGIEGDAWVTTASFDDEDGDLVPDGIDNCPGVANPDQADANGNGIGDVCESECSDGVDNDGDGLADAADPGCVDAADLSEQTPLVQCDDGADNDADGRVDYPSDPDCAGPEDNREARAGNGSRCGLGFEQILLLPVLVWVRRWLGRGMH
jgi:hypothetical protein